MNYKQISNSDEIYERYSSQDEPTTSSAGLKQKQKLPLKYRYDYFRFIFNLLFYLFFLIVRSIFKLFTQGL